MVKILKKAFKLCTSSSVRSFLGQRYLLGSFKLASGVMAASYVSAVGKYVLMGGSSAVAAAGLAIPGVLATSCVSMMIFDFDGCVLPNILCAITSIGFLLFMAVKVGGAMGMLMIFPMLCLLVECMISACFPDIDELMKVDPKRKDEGLSIFGLMRSVFGLFLCACVVMYVPCVRRSSVLDSFVLLCKDFSAMIASWEKMGLL